MIVLPANNRVEITSWRSRYCLQIAAPDRLGPDIAACQRDEILRRALQLDAPRRQHCHAWAQIGDILDDMGRQDHHDILADFGQQIEEAVAFLRVETGGGFVDDDQFGIADQRLRDAEALPHPARETGDRFLAGRSTNWSG